MEQNAAPEFFKKTLNFKTIEMISIVSMT